MGIVAYLQMQVGGPALHGDAQQIINIHSTLPPNNLPYDEPKSHWAQDDLSNGKGRGRDRPFWAGGSGRGTFQPARKASPFSSLGTGPAGPGRAVLACPDEDVRAYVLLIRRLAACCLPLPE